MSNLTYFELIYFYLIKKINILNLRIVFPKIKINL